MTEPLQIYEPETIEDPLNWLKSSLRQLANFDPVVSNDSSKRGQQLNYVKHTLLPTMRIVEIFLNELGLPESATQPVRYVVEAFEHAADERPHDLFRMRARRSKSLDSTEIWLKRLPVARLAAVLKEVEPRTNPLRRVYDELAAEISEIKSSGNPRQSVRLYPQRVIKGWLDFFTNNRQRTAKHAPSTALALRSLYAVTFETDLRHYKNLSDTERVKWFRKQLAAIKDDLTWYLEERR
ncbi:hypothetical protein [Afipia sp. 1NLS2]|uniref:hypothetical protein n=1 Tax=Afipia sp. 1NLS2 TaxID=666684 RepID=UPI0001D9E234|nr:hypothetical protein [Afipia sp. 1NLS2]EFI50017.1 hypothetical protein AfiDRAFT_3724 [Afipia sp. 1NLS2]